MLSQQDLPYFMVHKFKKYCIAVLLTVIAFPSESQVRSLDYYVNESLRNSPLLGDLQNQITSASIDSLIVLARRKPQVEWKSQLLYSPYNSHLGYDEVITDGGNYQAVGYVSQNIFNRRIIENELKSLNTEKTGLNINRRLTTAELKKTITSLYIASFSVYSDLQFNMSFLDLMKEQNRLIENLVRSGIYNQSDYLALVVETDGQQIIVSQLKNEYAKDIRLLNEACGLVDTSSVVLIKPEIQLAGVTTRSVYLQLEPFRIDSLKIINERDALQLRYKPTITWFADAGILTSNPWNFYRHFGASAGISLNFPIFDGKQKILEEKKLTYRENTRSLYNLNSRKQYDQQFLRLKGELEGLTEVRSQIATQLEVSDQLVRSMKSELEAGIIRMTDYLNALKGYRSINHNINLADIEILNIINEMNFLLAK